MVIGKPPNVPNVETESLVNEERNTCCFKLFAEEPVFSYVLSLSLLPPRAEPRLGNALKD